MDRNSWLWIPLNARRQACVLITLPLLAAITTFSVSAQVSRPNTYLVHNLVADLPNVADHQDTNLVNPWGNGFGATPFWIGNNRTGTSTLYDGTGAALSLVVSIPAAGGASGPGPVTGVVFNAFAGNTSAFAVASGKPAAFMFCAEDGAISGWNSSVDATHARILLDNSKAGAVYKGCALGGTAASPLFFAANFNSGAVDVFDGSLTPIQNSKAFVNPAVPAGFAPFNVAVLNGNVYVSWAKQDAQKHHDVAGAGNGYVGVFDMSGNLLASLISQGPLNSPWGMTIAPATFGPFGGLLLVGNFGDGKINAFSLSGTPAGTLNDAKANPIVIQGLWSLNFGSGARSEDPGTLYFTSGPGGGPNNDPIESHGIFGSVQAVPSFVPAGIQNAASFLPGPIAPNEWVTIMGSGLSATTGSWQFTGTKLPTQLNGVTVTVNNEPAPISFVSNTQINFLVPADISTGANTPIQVTNNGLVSAPVSVPVQQMAPGFFTIGTNTATGARYVAATHANGSLIGPAAIITGATPAQPGETIVLYGGGFGPASSAIPNGQAITTALTLPRPPLIVIDGLPAVVTFAGLTGTGLYQFNVVVPKDVQPGGDALVVALIGNTETQPNAFITIAPQLL
jgi:uncharacterized protein (TIGR03118 family)